MQQPVRVRHRRLRRAAARRPKSRLLPLALLSLAVIAAAITTGGMVLFAGYSTLSNELPNNPGAALASQNLGPAKIFDRKGKLLYEFEDEIEGLRNPVRLDEISDFVKKATIATEDNSFYDNPGVNVRGLARAGVENFDYFVGRDASDIKGSGGSSITQQLVKNVFIPLEERSERSLERKLKETVLALELTRKYSKDQILEWYLNQIPYGNRANGIGAAARRYFNTTAAKLTLAQAAMLAGLPQSPSTYDPYQHLEAAITRQYQVLDLMVKDGQITPAEAEAAKQEKLEFQTQNVSLLAPHWVFYVRDLAINQFGIDLFRGGGLNIYTTLDMDLQAKAEQIVEEKIAFYESPKGGSCECHNASLVAIDNNTGQILAMVGSRNYWDPAIEGENNNAIAIKQPGSAFKPVVYLSAFMKQGDGWNPGTTIYDQPTKFISRIDGSRREFFTPVGPTSRYLGPLSARDSLGSSMNTAAVKAAGFAGVDEVIDVAHKVGITSLDDRENYGVSIATGGANLTLLDLTFAYSTIANNGEMRGAPAIKPPAGHRKIDPAAILRVVDGNNSVLYEFRDPRREQVVPAGNAYQITDILKDNNAKRHTYNAPEIQFGMPDKRPVAAKTGTQQGPKNIKDVLATWNFGYVPDLTVGVWVGNANNALVNPNLTSASSSLLIWKEFMTAAIQMLNIPPKEFPVPPDIEWQMVNGKREPIVKGTKVVRAEDLKLWAAAGNSTSPVGGVPRDDTQPGGQSPAGTAAPRPAGPQTTTPGQPQPTPDDGEHPQATPPAGAAPTPAPPVRQQPTVNPQPAPPQPQPRPQPTVAPPPQQGCAPQPPFYNPCPRN
ncbi:MAG: transglycosylase domain-containing protein [Chloroflexi bacterium]|nr:transglycosylase domain-containing protein [Chloroflexota bacterium]